MTNRIFPDAVECGPQHVAGFCRYSREHGPGFLPQMRVLPGCSGSKGKYSELDQCHGVIANDMHSD